MALVTAPTFSVVIATYGRGELIEATLSSVAQQTEPDLEVLVVSDGPAAPGLATAVDGFDGRFRLLQTAARCGSQYGPNNHAWSHARGRFVAYLGHDDIWLRSHLAELREAFSQRPAADFAASGCLYFGPPGSGRGSTWATGLFDPDDQAAPLTHFFPPSSVAHRRDLPDDLRWPDAAATRRPVDSQFMLTAAERGCRFTSTGTVTVLKLNSALRYLSYLTPDDDEQRAALALTTDPPRLEAVVEQGLADAVASGQWMTTTNPSERDRQPGEAVRLHARVRGLDTPPLEELDGPTWVPVADDPRALDWYGLEGDGDVTWRWSGPNPRPRLLLPFRAAGPVRVSLHVAAFATDDVRDSLRVLVDRNATPAVTEQGDAGFVVSFVTALRQDRPAVVELQTSRTVPVAEFLPGSPDPRRVGVCLTGLGLEPV